MATPVDSAELSHLVLLIPAWRPDDQLIALLQGTEAAGFGATLVIDDGSPSRYASFFERAASMPRVRVLRHPQNLGKGRALKTAIAASLQLPPHFIGVVTADADGQHTARDIARVGAVLGRRPRGFVLGARQAEPGLKAEAVQAPGNATGVHVPLRSALGNRLTRFLVRRLHGADLRDTQTGLRAFARDLLPELLRVRGERYEYEMAALLHLCRSGVRPLEVPITTVYREGNRGSHFRPVQDSWRVYRALLLPAVGREPQRPQAALEPPEGSEIRASFSVSESSQ